MISTPQERKSVTNQNAGNNRNGSDPSSLKTRVHPVRYHAKIIIHAFIFALLATGMNSCVKIKIWMDNSGLSDYSDQILEAIPSENQKSGVQRSSLIKDVVTRPDSVRIQIDDLNQWKLKDTPVQKKATFASSLLLENGQPDTAVFYIYGNTELKDSRVILWVPGFGVSDFAFRFIRQFFYNELAAGYTVVFYNIPFHLNRVEEGREPGEGMISGDNQVNLRNIQHALYEIKVIINYLEKEQVQSISGWGGSIGAVFLWLASTEYKFEHLSLMIPVVDWETLIFHDQMERVREKMNQSGISDQALRNMYKSVSPINTKSLTDSQKIQVLYARFDQFTPESRTLDFTRKWGISNVISYPESHASILINSGVYKDNLKFLQSLP